MGPVGPGPDHSACFRFMDMPGVMSAVSECKIGMHRFGS
jgi:hypothetical protein